MNDTAQLPSCADPPPPGELTEMPPTLFYCDHILEDRLLSIAVVQPERWPEIEPHAGLLQSPRNRHIHRAMCECSRKNGTIDLAGIRARLDARGVFNNDKVDSVTPENLGDLEDGRLPSVLVQPLIDALTQLKRRAGLAADLVVLGKALELDNEPGELLAKAAKRYNDAAPSRFTPADIHSDAVIVTEPRFRVYNLLPESGLVLLWSQPNAGKTYYLLRVVHELMSVPRPATLNGHPDLRIDGTCSEVLWLASEEDAGRLKHRAEAVLRGMGNPTIDGKLLHLFAADPEAPLSMLDLPELVEQVRPHVVVVDSLTGLLPKVLGDGRRPAWDIDNGAANEMCMILRGLTARYGVTIILVHHTGREGGRYRGATDWWASADVMFGIEPADDGRMRLKPEKNRNGRVLPAFHLNPQWSTDDNGQLVYSLTYEPDDPNKLSACAARVHEELHGKPNRSQAEMIQAIEAEGKWKPTRIKGAIGECVTKGYAKHTNKYRNRSEIYGDVCGGPLG